MRISSTRLITGAIVLLSILFSSKGTFAQQAIPTVGSDGIPTDIVTYINGDTTSAGARKNTSYTLSRGAVYFALGTIQSNFNLTISAAGDASAAPQIVILTDKNGNNAKPFQPFKNLTLNGLYVSGVDAAGKQLSDLIETGATNIRISLNKCTFDSVKNRIVIADKDSCSIFLEDCYVSNLANSSHGGRVVDARETYLDSVSFVNCTFYNVMHCIINRFSGGERYFKYDHNTAYNLPRSILRIDECPEVIVTNNLFLQTGFAGFLATPWDSAIAAQDMGDRDEWSRIELNPLGAVYTGLTQKINFKKNNFWLDPAIPATYPDSIRSYVNTDFPFENQMIGADSLTWINENVNFTNVPTCKYLEMCQEEWADGSPQTNPGFTDNTRPYYFTYSTSSASYTAAEGGFPLGDLNWWPTKKAEWTSWLTDVKADKGSKIPATFSLSNAYPNPFNPTTNIKFTVANSENVKLMVFNVLGQRIKTLVNGEMKAGSYNATWNGTDEFGAHVASGIYFYRLESQSFNSTKKMILMK